MTPACSQSPCPSCSTWSPPLRRLLRPSLKTPLDLFLYRHLLQVLRVCLDPLVSGLGQPFQNNVRSYLLLNQQPHNLDQFLDRPHVRQLAGYGKLLDLGRLGAVLLASNKSEGGATRPNDNENQKCKWTPSIGNSVKEFLHVPSVLSSVTPDQ